MNLYLCMTLHNMLC